MTRRWFTTDRLLLAGVLLLAAFLRLFYLQFGEYQWDDERQWAMAVHAVANHSLPLQGVLSTIGVPNGPLQIDLLIPFAIFSRSPFPAIVGMAALNVVAVYFLYDLVDSFFSRRAALIAALLFAVNSWALIFSRHLGQQGMMLPFQVLFFWNAARWLARGGGLDLVLMFLWAAIMPQIYIDGLIHAGTLAAILVIGRRQIQPMPLLLGFGLAAGAFMPYLVGGLLPSLSLFPSYAALAPRTDFQSVLYSIGQAFHIGLQLDASNMAQVLDSFTGVEQAFLMLEGTAYVLGIGYGIWRLSDAIRQCRPVEARLYGMLAIWLFLPMAVHLRHQDIVTWRHLMLTLPLPAVFTGLLLDRVWPWPGAVAAALLGGNSVALAGVFFVIAPTCGPNNGYGLPYQYTFDIADSIRRLAVDHHANDVYVDGYPAVAPTLSSILSRDGLNAIWSDPEHGPELDMGSSGRASVYVTLSEGTDNALFLRGNLNASQVQEQDLPCVGGVLRAYALTQRELNTALGSQPSTPLVLRGQSGLNLRSATLNRRLEPGQLLRIGVSWLWPSGVRPPSDYWLFAHLLDSSGRVVGQHDVPLRPTAGWVQNEEIVSWIDVPVPAGTPAGRYVLELGLYDNRGVRTDLFDATGKPAGDTVLIQPLIVPPAASTSVRLLSPANARFGDDIELTGFEGRPSAEVTLSWRALRHPGQDYTVFVHALDASGKLVAQADGEPAGGNLPTGVWLPGETVLDTHQLTLAPGQYRVEVGMYYLPTLERLPGEPFAFELTAR